MSTLPSLNTALFGLQSFKQTEPNCINKQEQECEKGMPTQPTLDNDKKETSEVDIFTPMRVIGRMDLRTHALSKPGYAWTIYKKTSDSTIGNSDNDEPKVSESVGEKVDSKQHADAQSMDDFSDKPESKSDMHNTTEDLIEEFQNKPWMQDPKSNKCRPKAIPDKKLAVRSDVVNKTLLRSLKRYYTAKFDESTKGKLQNKGNQKDELYVKLKEFTEAIYKDDPRFNLSEFVGVTMEDLVFYMGICINPLHMKRKASTPQERNKFQNFYNCLYKYSHKKLLKLFSSNVLHFMFRKFFEDGPFQGLLKDDGTLKKHPEVYQTASENFLSLFKEN